MFPPIVVSCQKVATNHDKNCPVILMVCLMFSAELILSKEI